MKCSQTFQQTLTLFTFVYLCLPFPYLFYLFLTFVYLFLTLVYLFLTFVQMTHLCTNFVLVKMNIEITNVQCSKESTNWHNHQNSEEDNETLTKVWFGLEIIFSLGILCDIVQECDLLEKCLDWHLCRYDVLGTDR